MTEVDALEVFSSSLHSLFDHVVPATGDPLELFTYDPPRQSRQPSLTCRIPPQQVNFLFAHHVWNSSLVLADRISTSNIAGLELELAGSNTSNGRTVCELGCGAGIPGLLVARSPNVTRVVLTDYADPLLVENLRSNINLAYQDDQRIHDKLKALGHTWGERDSLEMVLKENQNERFTDILMADTLWLTEAQSALVSSLVELLALTPTARIHLVAGFHSGRHAVRSFLHKAKRAGFEEKEAYGKGWEELAVGGETRLWGWDLRGRDLKDGEWVDEVESSSERGKWVVVGEMGWSDEKLEELQSQEKLASEGARVSLGVREA